MITTTENNMTPQETVDALDRYIIGQTDAKKAVAIALRIAGDACNWVKT